MAGKDDAIRIEGLREFKALLKRVDGDLPKALRKALNEAAYVVVEGSKPWMPSRSGRARASIWMRSTQTEARVREGGNRAPYAPWVDFGGKRTRTFAATGQTHTDPVGRRVRRGGRVLWPTLAKRREQVQAVLTGALTDVAKQAGMDTEVSG